MFGDVDNDDDNEDNGRGGDDDVIMTLMIFSAVIEGVCGDVDADNNDNVSAIIGSSVWYCCCVLFCW